MAVTRNGQSIIMTAVNDTITDRAQGFVKCTSIRLVGTGMMAGQRLTIRNHASALGEVIVDHYVKSANEDEELWGQSAEGEIIDRPYLAAVPSTGTWTVLFRIRL